MRRAHVGIIWIQRQFVAAKFERGRRTCTWTTAEAIDDLPSFNQAIAIARKELNLPDGAQTFIVHESDRLSHPLTPAPPMRRRDLVTFLDRKANQLSPFDEEPVWGYTRALPSREGDSVVLHIMPRSFVDGVIRICEEFQLHPVSILPLSEAMALRIHELAEGSHEICMLVGLFPFQSEIVVARGDGSLLFVRDLGYGREGNDARLAQEIGRSALFARQRFGAGLDRIWIAGAGSSLVASQLDDDIGCAIEPLEEEDPVSWTHAGGKRRSSVPSNLVPVHVRNQRRARVMMRLTAALTILLAASSGIAAWEIERLIRAQGAGLRAAKAEIRHLEDERQQWLNQQAEHVRVMARLKAFEHNALPNLAPLWFARYLAARRPFGVHLEQLDIALARVASTNAPEPVWQFLLRGHANHPQNSLRQMEATLTEHPVSAHILQGWRSQWLHILRQNGIKDDEMAFVIKGELH